MHKDTKKLLREEKRQIKKDGNRSRRRHLQRQLLNDPDNAHNDEYDFDHNSSTHLNGMDSDSKRKKEDYEHHMFGQDNEEEREVY